MAVPKRKMSRSNTRSRRANWKATSADLVPVAVNGEIYRVPRRLVRGVERGYVDPATVGM
ncbi:50S ribosomal protein L32 [Austwickia chelonae]|uniref:50S ribosomal protein L32 n=1 Tax=Austwickia chelonae TaxID=100225 RepID=UPI000E24D17E|nr:50S ribosomal protein L32 [Austwickia chelonae]